ncbi:hypothetical protein SBA1_100078 [Candidatus Sulfotelmatobacter kueseliae]|uniref:Uncharacterized protein n=1 Tax=Candidatus Sulfotelmatobacter kueseliae TaxID=2042962 RepID=A0A2U3JW21_9BACT|nr:hypothetical protein SBA1_100078 [Candidatus Sulfotelmatobacter kueseliae]
MARQATFTQVSGKSSASGGKAEDGQPHRPIPHASSAKSFSPLRVLRGWWWRSKLRVLLPEIGSLIHRIRWVLEIREWEHRGYQGPLPLGYLWHETPQAEISKRAYIRYMQQKMTHLYPFLTIVDWLLLEHVWFAGWEYGGRIDTGQNQQELQDRSWVYPDGGNSSLPPATHQSTKRDRPDPLP